MTRCPIFTATVLVSGCLLALEFLAAQEAPRARPPVPGPAGIVRGEVSSQGERLAFANVIVVGTRLGTLADSSGRFVLAGVPTGPRRIIFSALGYRKLDSLIVVRVGENPHGAALR